MFFWNSLAFSMIQRMLAIWSLVLLPFLKPAWISGSSHIAEAWLGELEDSKRRWTSFYLELLRYQRARLGQLNFYSSEKTESWVCYCGPWDQYSTIPSFPELLKEGMASFLWGASNYTLSSFCMWITAGTRLYFCRSSYSTTELLNETPGPYCWLSDCLNAVVHENPWNKFWHKWIPNKSQLS